MSIDIACVGTFAYVTSYRVNGLVLAGYGETVDTHTMIGNDAVIVARLLARRGLHVRCILVDPTVADIGIVKSLAPPNMDVDVDSTDMRAGCATTAAVLQTDHGDRYWLLPQPPGLDRRRSIQLADSRLVYADLYDELESWLISQLTQLGTGVHLIINLSGSGHTRKAQLICKLRPFVVQASVRSPVTPTELTDTAKRLRVAAGAECAVVTAGACGASLSIASDCYFSVSTNISQIMHLGAGAAFTAGLVEAVIEGDSWHDTLHRAERSAVDWVSGVWPLAMDIK